MWVKPGEETKEYLSYFARLENSELTRAVDWQNHFYYHYFENRVFVVNLNLEKDIVHLVYGISYVSRMEGSEETLISWGKDDDDCNLRRGQLFAVKQTGRRHAQTSGRCTHIGRIRTKSSFWIM